MTRKKNLNLFSKGKLNRLVDNIFHPLFHMNKGYVLVDGVLHGLVEQNPALSAEKFVRYSLPELMKSKGHRIALGERRRSYNCALPLNTRCIFCNYKRAGPWCLKAAVWKVRCPKLVISYKRACKSY
jgi:hypothetical protein